MFGSQERAPQPAEAGRTGGAVLGAETLAGPAAAAHYPPVEQPRGVRAPRALLTSTRERTGSGPAWGGGVPGAPGSGLRDQHSPRSPRVLRSEPKQGDGWEPKGRPVVLGGRP